VSRSAHRTVRGDLGNAPVVRRECAIEVVDVENALWLMLVIGVFIGWWLGRRTAENRRARTDMDRVWDARKNYRDG
jgi:hypothetical protein